MEERKVLLACVLLVNRTTKEQNIISNLVSCWATDNINDRDFCYELATLMIQAHPDEDFSDFDIALVSLRELPKEELLNMIPDARANNLELITLSSDDLKENL